MVQAAEARERDDFAGALGLYVATIGGVLVQGEVGPVAMVVVEVLTKEAPEMAFSEHDDVVGELATKRAEEAFASAVLPRRTS